MTPQHGPVERRRSARFALQERLWYSILEGQKTVTAGTGITIDLSSSGVAFTTEHSLKPGTLVKLSMDWPRKAAVGPSLRVAISGRIVRADAGIAACTIERYEYRIQKRS